MAEETKVNVSNLSDEELKQLIFGNAAGGLRPNLDTFKVEPEVPGFAVGVGRGAMDLLQGARQKYLNYTDPEAAKTYTQNVNEEIANYEKGRAAGGETGYDFPRLTGSIAASTPTMLVPGGKGLVARIGTGAAVGGPLSYLNYSQENQPTQNLYQGALGAGVGGLLGAVAPSLISGAVTGTQYVGSKLADALRSGKMAVQGGVDTVRQALGSTTPDAITKTITDTLSQRGIDFGKLSTEMKDSLLKAARDQLSVAGKLNAEQLARQADIESVVGAGQATLGQVTRSPFQWSAERNLQKVEANLPEVQKGGPSLTGRYMSQDQQMKSFADKLINQIRQTPSELYPPQGAQPASATQASEGAIKAVQERNLRMKEGVSELYNAYRDSGVGDVAVPDVKLADAAGRVLDTIGVENVPASVLNRLKEFGFFEGKRTKLLTVNEADKLNKLINVNNPGFGSSSAALAEIQKALNESLLDVPVENASKMLLAARKAHSARMTELESGKGVTRAVEDVSPDRYFERNVIGGDVRDIKALKDYLIKTPEGGQAWNNLSAQVGKQLLDKATEGGRAAFSGAQFENAMNAIGIDRLKLLFTPAELAQLETLKRGSLAMTYQPPFSAVNVSNTAPTLMAQALSLGNKIPGVNVVTKPVAEELSKEQTSKSLAQALSTGNVASLAREQAQAAQREKLVAALMKRIGSSPSALYPASIAQELK